MTMGHFRFHFQIAARCECAFSRRNSPEVCSIHCPSLKSEGAGKTGCALHPRSRVQRCTKKCAHEHTGSAETLRPSPRNGFTAYSVLSLVTGFFATIAPEQHL